MSKIKSLYFRNFVGIKELDRDANPDKNVVSGKNGTGKSSTLNGIADLFGASEVVKILRDGEKEGESVALLDDGTKIKKEFDEEGNEKVTITDPLRGKIPQADTKKKLKQFTTAFALRPMAFLTCDDKDRAKILLGSMKIEVPESSVVTMQKSGIDTKTLSITQDKLSWLNAQHSEITKNRRDINRNAKELAIHVTKLEETLPKKSGADIKSELRDAVATVETLRGDFLAKKIEYDSEYEVLVKRAEGIWEGVRDETEKLYLKKLTDLNAWKEQTLEKERTDLQNRKDAAIRERDEAVADAREEFDPKIKSADALVIELKTKHEANTGYDKLREEIGNERMRIAKIREESEKLTGQLDLIDTVKLKILEKLPVEGIDIKSDEKGNPVVLLDGHPWNDANTARRVEIGFQNALSMMGDLRTVLIDDAEHLDEETTEEIARQAKALDVQVFFAPVTNTVFSFNGN